MQHQDWWVSRNNPNTSNLSARRKLFPQNHTQFQIIHLKVVGARGMREREQKEKQGGLNGEKEDGIGEEDKK